MDGLPSKSISKPILLAIPLFCLILAVLGASDELSYLFVLEFLDNMAGTPDITFLPSQQPQIGKDYQKQQFFNYQGLNLMDSNNNGTQIPLVRKQVIEEWANTTETIRGVSPRWLVPVVVNRTDSLILVTDVQRELGMGLGLKSHLQGLGENEVALSGDLLGKSGKQVGEQIEIELSIKDLFNGRKLVEKYQSFASEDEDGLIGKKQLQLEQLSKYLAQVIQQQGASYNLTVSEEDIHKLVEYVYNLEFKMAYTIKYEYQNSGLISSALSNVVLMEFDGLSRLLTEFAAEALLDSKPLEDIIFQQLDQSGLDHSQVQMAKTYWALGKASGTLQGGLEGAIRGGIEENPLMMVATYRHRELIYHPSGNQREAMYAALESCPSDFQVISTFPFYEQLANIRYFFKSVIQIFTFVCAVVFFYTMRLILKQVHEEKEIEVGIWRTLGAGGVSQKAPQKQEQKQGDPQQALGSLKLGLSLSERLRFGYKMLVKVGFVYYWLLSCVGSVGLYQGCKWGFYWLMADLFGSEAAPPLPLLPPLVLLLLVFGFTLGLVVVHIREIYVNPLVSTIKPVKRTFDLVKIRVIKIATFGITVEILVTGVMLVFYGVVSYYWIPLSILEQDGELQTALFNSIFIFLILGSIMLLVILQARMESWVLRLLFRLSPRLNTLKLIMLKSIKAKQYKNLKVSLIISLIFAFLLFVTAGINIELKIIESFSERAIGADLMVENLEKQTLDRPKIQAYLDQVGGLSYAWFSQNLERSTIKMGFQTITRKGTTTCAFRAVTANFLDTAYYEYYYPEQYFQSGVDDLEVLPNRVRNGFSTLYRYDGQVSNFSLGRYDPADTLTEYDPHGLNVPELTAGVSRHSIPQIPEEEQVIRVVLTSLLRRKLGASAGDYFKLLVNNTMTGQGFYFRCQVMHSLKVAPGVDPFRSFAYMSEQQANYIFQAIGYDPQLLHYNKLFVRKQAGYAGQSESGSGLQEVGNRILSMSPDHTEVVEISQVRLSFQLLETYLNGFVLFITFILSVLSVLFLTVYTHGKCKEEAEVFKMLRAIGLSVFDIRLMVYLEILVRMVISIINGVLLGLVFSMGLSGQVEEILMLKAPLPSLTIVGVIAVTLLTVFSLTIIRSTSYLSKRTVLETTKA